MVIIQNDNTLKNLKCLLTALKIWFTILHSKNRLATPFIINFYLWYTYKMKIYKLKVKRVPADFLRKKVAESANKSPQFIGDCESCALISEDTCNLLGRKQWLCLQADSPIENDNTPLVQSITHKDVPVGVIYVKEDVFYNLARRLSIGFCDNSFRCNCYPVSGNYVGHLASSVKVASILAPIELSPEDEAEVLEAYFRNPRFLNIGDVFSISLAKFVVHLHKSAKYHTVEEFHFKVLEMQTHDKDWHPSEGLYVIKDDCDLYSSAPIASFLPQKTKKVSRRNKFEEIEKLIPPDLAKYTSQMSALFKPFIEKRKDLRVQPMFLLTGVQGSGKMAALQAVSQKYGVHLFIVDCYEFHGVGVQAIEAKFDFIFTKVTKIGPCILALTSLELLGRSRGNKEDVRVINSYLQHATAAFQSAPKHPLVIVGVTSQKVDSLLPSLRRAFVQIVKFEAAKPAEALSAIVWLAMDRGFKISEQMLEPSMNKVQGFIHGDLALLVRHAIRIMIENGDDQLMHRHFEQGIELMDAAYSDAIGAAKVPSVHWDDVGGLAALKKEVALTLSLPQQKPGLLSGSLRRSGILFYGPPGTGKTLMAKAVATECGMNFLSVKGPELMNMYVGQSEKNVREVFERAREAAPCILFFDELDSLAPNRGKSGDGGGVTDRVVSQLLSEMDGLQSNRGLFVIAATNRPDLVDPALLRPGRFDKMFYLGPCVDVEAKLSVLQALTKKFTLADDVDLAAIAASLPSHVTGADVYSVCSNAWLSSARTSIQLIQKGAPVSIPLPVTADDFARGIADLVPSLTAQDLTYYQELSASTDRK